MAKLEHILKKLNSKTDWFDDFSSIDMELEHKLWEIFDRERKSEN